MWIFSLLVFLCLGALLVLSVYPALMLSDSEFPGNTTRSFGS